MLDEHRIWVVAISRLELLNTKPPSNYVAGVGRDATGFTTRSDIGPAHSSTTVGLGRGNGIRTYTEEDCEEKFDEFGNDFGLFASAEDEEEAEAVWEWIDRRIGSRRKDRREVRMKQELQKNRALNPNITEQFAGLKRKLSTISAKEWDGIPEICDYSKRYKKMKKRFESFVPVPDTLWEKAIKEQEKVTSLDPNSSTTNLTAVGEGRGTMLSLKLDRISDSITGLTVVDPKRYVTDLNSMKITSFSENMDTKKARLLFKLITKTNPKHPPGWIGAARLEEAAGDMRTAQQLIQKGYKECPKSEDVWLEACRLANSNEEEARADDVKKKSQILRKGLEHVPDSVRLWKAVVELANEEDARVLLLRAVECCPMHIELWLALARLETYEGAKKVLKRARMKLSKEPAIWITAAKLEEANGNTTKVGEVIERGIHALQGQGLVLDREGWMMVAEAAERAGFVVTCQAIIRNTVGIGVEEEDLEMTWIADA
ncbi:hypothetical protein MRB53_031929 [Persea americana]|uniref:Uncharacterized protein n=1 Tax=Persea americana TaxID=3435 RepID=A0ACC2KQG4_PERAE|nr:hypothetical protein MRB53_031929 [Persea americana]